MKCPSCSCTESKVIDSRHADENNLIRRRRECAKCGLRYTTYEIIDTLSPIVIKKDGTRELFDRNKLLSGLMKACQKRPVSADKILEEVEGSLQGAMRSEVSSKKIGEIVMEKLKNADAVAYVRFASVHREFKDIETFAREISALQDEQQKAKNKDK